MSVAEDQGKREWLDKRDKEEGLKSLYYFGKFILGYQLEEKPHREMCDFVQYCVLVHKKGLQLVPRGTYKTTIVSQILPLWMIARDANIRILLDSVVLKNSERNLEVIKNMISRNERFCSLYGNYKDKDNWRAGEIIVSKRTNLSLKEPTVGTSSVDTIEVGPHWDLIIPDDLHNEKNTKTREQIEQIYEHFKLLFSLLDPGCAIFLVGTRWTDLDTYGKIIEDHKAFLVMERKAIEDDGTLFFPTRFPKDVLDDILDQQKIFMFSAQYLNDPMPQGEDADFHKENFMYEKAPADMKFYMLVDPALSESLRADESGIAIAGNTKDNDIYVDKTIGVQLKPGRLVNKICNNVEAYGDRLKAIAIETNFFQKILKYALQKELKERGLFIKIIEVHHNKKKTDRILGLQPLYEAQCVYHHPGLKGGKLEEQLLKFPRSRRDDIADALASILDIIKAKRPKKKAKERQGQSSVEDMIQRAANEKQAKKRKPRYVHPMLGSNF